MLVPPAKDVQIDGSLIIRESQSPPIPTWLSDGLHRLLEPTLDLILCPHIMPPSVQFLAGLSPQGRASIVLGLDLPSHSFSGILHHASQGPTLAILQLVFRLSLHHTKALYPRHFMFAPVHSPVPTEYCI